VSLGERLSVGPYGALHRAATASRRDLRALVVSPELARDRAFSQVLRAQRAPSELVSFDHPSAIPTLTVEDFEQSFMVVTLGGSKPAAAGDER
jgi:hypothetical protein